MALQENHMKRYCPDRCKDLHHSVLGGGFCLAVKKDLNSYDISSCLVKYIRDKKCPKKSDTVLQMHDLESSHRKIR